MGLADRSDQVQIFEPILGDSAGRVTTGLLTAVRYLKDNRLLPNGFINKRRKKISPSSGKRPTMLTSPTQEAWCAILCASAMRPFHIQAELWYQPIGFRWAHNLNPYDAVEPHRFVQYYQSMASSSAVVLARLARAEARQ